MKERILENRRNFSARNFDDRHKLIDPIILEPSKKVVANVLSGNTFITTDNNIIRIKDVHTPEKNHKGYSTAFADLKSILKQNATVKVIPIKIETSEEILAKVEMKSKDIANIMRKKGWSKDKAGKKAKIKTHEKHRWQEKYEKSKSNHQNKNSPRNRS